MNRKLLFLGIFLGMIAMTSSLAIIFLTDETTDNLNSYANFQVAFQINLFHAILLVSLAWMKRKYTDQNLVTAGWIFVISTLLLAIPAYLGIFSEFGEMLFETVGIIGGLGLIVGWCVLTKSFYDVYMVKEY